MTNLPIKIEVLDKGYVELIDFMGDDDAPVDAARVSFAKAAENYTKEQNDKLTKYLLDHKHGTPFEMITYKFRVHAPVVVWWQWVRHRHMSYNFVSGRYVPFQEDQVYVPSLWRKQSISNKQGSAPGEYLDPMSARTINNKFKELIENSYELYDYMVNTAGIAKEQARLVLPGFALYYTAIVQCNARSLMNFLSLRDEDHAQSEIRDYAKAMKTIVSETHPRIFHA